MQVFRLISILFSIVIFNKCYSQDETLFAPFGSTWYYTLYSWPNPPELLTFTSAGDTILDGLNARIIECYTFHNEKLEKIDSLTKYAATVGSKVFYRVSNEFVLLYDFGASPGDTIHSAVESFPIFMGCESDFSKGVIQFSYVVDEVDSISIGNVVLTTQEIHMLDNVLAPTWNISSPITERIGQVNFGGFWWGRGEGCLLENLGFIRCYQDIDVNFRNPYINENTDCNTTIVNEINFDDVLKLFPNPAIDLIYLNENVSNINIYDLNGAIKLSLKTGNIIDISLLPQGIYLIKCHINNIVQYNTFLKLY